MALTVIKPSGIETSGNYTVNGMNVSANATVANLSVTTSLTLLTNSANLGPVGNVIITGGTNGYVLQTDGSGNLSWVAQSGGGSTSNISNGNSNVNIPSANGNINFTAVGNTTMVVTGTGANISGTLNITGNLVVGNANLGNAATANFFTGTLTTNAQPNITSVGTLTSLIVTGNVTGGNLVTAGKVYSSDFINGGTGIYLSAGPSGYINFFTTGGDKATITDTGNIVASNVIANSTVFAVTANISGNANLGNAATANFFIGSGNNLSNISGANVTGQVANALIAGTVYTNAQPNITSVGTLTDLSVSGNGVFGGNLTVNGTLTYINSTTLSISDPIINLQTGPNGAAPVANTGKDVGTALNYYDTSAKIAWMGWDVSNAEIAFGSNVGISSEVVTFTSLANIRSGNAQLGNLANANYFTGNGSLLTGITTTNISNGNSNVNIPTANGNINFTAVGNTTMVITGTGANITGTANITGNLTAGNINAGSGTGGNIIGANLISANYFTGTLTTNAQPNITSVGTLSSLEVTANGTFGNILGSHANGNSNVNIPAANGNINFTAVGNTIMVITGTGVNVAGTLNTGSGVITGNGNGLSSIVGANVTGQVGNALVSSTVYTNAQPNITSVGSLSGLTVSNATGIVDFTTTANVTLGAVANLHISGGTNAYVLSTDGSGNLSWVAQSGGGGGGANISNGNSNVNIPTANGNINFSAVGNANVVVITGTGANISGYANITGNVALSGANVSLGAVANLHISGGSNTYVLSTDGSGNLTWAAASGTSIGVDNFTGNGVETAYTLTSTPANANATLVSIAGTFQPRTVYSLTGNVITFSSAPPNTAPIEVTTFTAGSGGGGGGGITAQDLLSPFLLMGA